MEFSRRSQRVKFARRVKNPRAVVRTRAARFNGPQPEVPAERINYRPAGESSDKLPVLTRGRIELSLPNTLDWRERGELSLFRCA